MPPILALIACVVFVLILLRLDKIQSSSITRALWIPTIWILYTGSKPLNVWFPFSGATLESSPLDRAFMIGLLGLAIWILVRRKFVWSAAIKENAWLIVLLGYMLVSALWSSEPSTSFVRWVRSFQAVIMAFVIMSEPSPPRAVESILRRITYILIPFSVLLIKYFPYYGRAYSARGEPTWIGVTLQKNGLGRLCLIAILYLFWSMARRWKKGESPSFQYQSYVELFMLAISLRLIRGPWGTGYSATALVSTGVAIIVYLGLQAIKKSGLKSLTRILTFGLLFIIVVGILSVFTGGAAVGSLSTYVGRERTLTDRTLIWAILLPVALQNPIFGRGFEGVYTASTRQSFRIGDAVFGEAHNGYLDVLLGLGFVGLVLTTLFILSSCRKAQRMLSTDYEWAALWICFLIAALVHNISESSIHALHSQLMAVIVFFSVSSAKAFSGTQESDADEDLASGSAM